MSLRFFCSSAFLLLLTNAAVAQFSLPGQLDTSFNYGRPYSSFTDPANPRPGAGANNVVFCTVLQPDGKLLIGGDFSSYNGTPRSLIARLHADGSLDGSFNPGAGANNTISALLLQPDGKLVIGGRFTTYNGAPRNRIARLHADGSLDTTFNPGVGANNSVLSLAFLPDGKVLIGGRFTSYNGTACNRIARLHADGSLDTTFKTGTGANSNVGSFALQPDGKVLVGGWFTSYNGTPRRCIARLHADGSLDTNFNQGNGVGGSFPELYSLALQPDGKVLIGGDFTSYNGISRNRIARLDSEGSLDTTFNPGTGANAWVSSLARQPDGKVLIGGLFSNYNGTFRNQIARLHADGSLDTTFNPGTGVNGLSSLTLQPDGKVLIGGQFTSYNGIASNRITRLHADGSLDISYNPAAVIGANGAVWRMSVLPDQKILIAGNFTRYNGITQNGITRLQANGSLDTSFRTGTGANNAVLWMEVQPDGKVLIAGSFTSYNGTARNGIARLNADGSLDSSFNPGTGTGANGTIVFFVLQPNGKVLIGGSFSSYNGMARNNIARLNADGSLDTSFDPGIGASSTVYTLALQPDGKVLIGGLFFTYNGVSRSGIARLHADGRLDASFNPGTGVGLNSLVYSIDIQQDGKVLIGGSFTSYNGTARNNIARLNVDGSLDASFNPGTGAGGVLSTAVYYLALQPDGKVLIGGTFTAYNGTPRNRIARLNTNGSLDASFDPGAGANDFVGFLSVQPNGQLWIGGNFSSYNGIVQTGVARIQSNGLPDPRFNVIPGANDAVLSLAVQADERVVVAGEFTAYNGLSSNRLTRLLANGALDDSFSPGTGANATVRAVALQPDGKLLIGGAFTSYNGMPRNRIARLLADGRIDNSFEPGAGAEGVSSSPTLFALALQPDGRVLIGGAFTSYNGTSRSRIARLLSDGSLDASFNPGSGVAGTSIPTIRCMALQPDGRVLIGGAFTSYNGTPRAYIARLLPDGNLDASFNPGAGTDGPVTSLVLQPDGKVLIGGDFANYDGTTRSRVARLLSDGRLDTTFNPGAGPGGAVQALALQADGKVLVGGFFTTYNGTTRHRMALLQPNGSLDTTFNPGTGLAGASSFLSVYAFAVQPDSRILIGGDFGSYNGTTRNNVARVLSSVDCARVPKASWTGAISSDWHTAGNWSTGYVPGGATHVIIGAAANMCVIGTAHAMAHSVQVLDGGRLEQRHGYRLQLVGRCTQLPPP